MSDKDITRAANGTWTVKVYNHERPIRGIPTRSLAERIVRALDEAEACGASNPWAG